MQPVELKKTDRADWSAALKKYIEKEFMKDSFAEHKDAVERINNLRREVRDIQDKSEGSIDILLRYYNILSHIDQRFPVNEENIKIPFTWFDAFKGRKCALFRIPYEKVCVLFNVGAIYTWMACAQNVQSMEGLKDAAKFFQMAAGVFAQLKEDSVFVVGQLSPDLTPEACDCLMHLCLAQAQECFAERAYRQPMKPSIVAALAAGAARLYETVYKAITRAPLAGNVDRAWNHFVPFKMHYFMIMHHYCLSRVVHDEDKYGTELAYLNLADHHIQQTRQLGGVTPEVSTQMNMLITKVQQAHNTAFRDNEQIYHERVPKPEELPPAAPRELVNVTPVKPLIESKRDGAEVFAALVPMDVKKSLDKYNEDKQKLVQVFNAELKEHDSVIEKKKQELNLPDCLQITESSAIPDGLQKDIDEYKRTNGPAYLIELHEQVNAMGDEARNMHTSILASLNTEEEEDKELAERFKREWTRIPSAQLNRSFRADLATYRSNIDAAKRSDLILQDKLDTYRPEFDLLMLPQSELEAFVPSYIPAGAGGADCGLRELLAQLDNIVQQRIIIAQETEQQGQQQADGITAELIKGQRLHEEIITNALGLFNPLREREARLLQQQQDLLQSLTLAHAKFMSQRQGSDLLTQKEAAVKRFRDAVTHFKEVKGNLTEGFDFYGRLQDVLRQLKQKVDDFLLARSTERADILQRIQMQLAGVQPQQQHQMQQQYSQYPAPSSYQAQQSHQQPQHGAPQYQQPQQYQPQQPQHPQQQYQQPTYQQPTYQQPSAGQYPPPQQQQHGQPQYQQPQYQQPQSGYPYPHAQDYQRR